MVEPENATIEAEEVRHEDADSAYGDELASYTTSLSSSVTNYKYENGRRYHAFRQGSYVFPNDEGENHRLDIMHHLITLRLNGRLHRAPIKDPHRILDIGTGTGIWAIEMGDQYPSAEILGNDLSAIQPRMVPPNVRFEVDDVEAEWVYTSRFDYIHCRHMTGSLKDWPRLVAQVYKNLKPGGWAEFNDFDMWFYSDDGTYAKDTAAYKWCAEIDAGLRAMERDPQPGKSLRKWVTDAGFVNINEERYKIPVGMWPKDKKLKEIGAYNLMQFLDGLDGISMAVMTRIRGWKAEEVTVFLPDVKKDLRNRDIHIQYDMVSLFCQKPLEQE